MNVAVVGLWHLGSVTAACLAKAGHQVIAFDENETVILALQKGTPPIFEPGLNELLVNAETLTFSSNPQDLTKASVVWVTYDTPVNEKDEADVDFVVNNVKQLIPYLQKNTLILISSQLPVGTTRQLSTYCHLQWQAKNITFAVSPENLRLGKAIEVFTKPDRVVVGLEVDADRTRIQDLFKPFTQHIIWMSIESAEMTKHAVNAFLATSVVFINELAMLCERTGADASEVERGLKTEERIGPKAYLKPGGAIGGGTLLRDIHYLIDIGKHEQINTPLFSGLLDSNEAHKQWACQRIVQVMKTVHNKKIALLGLTYKAGTDTLRRSTAVETGLWLAKQGATIVAFDPNIKELPDHLSQYIQLESTIEAVLDNTEGIIVTIECPEFASLTIEMLLKSMKEPLIFDASGYLMKTLGIDKRVRYFSVGR